MPFKNPILQVDTSVKFKLGITFIFDDYVDIKNSIDGITRVILEAIYDNNGKIPTKWVRIVE